MMVNSWTTQPPKHSTRKVLTIIYNIYIILDSYFTLSSICTVSGVHLVRKYILCTFPQLGWAKSWDSSNGAVIRRAPLLDHYGAFYFVLLFNNDVFHLLQLLKLSWPVKHTFIITSCAISTAKDRQIRKNILWFY